MMVRIIDDLGVSDYIGNRYTKITEMIGKILVEKDKRLREKLQAVVREDLTTAGNTVLYTTAVAQQIDQALRPKLVAQNVIKKIDMKGAKGVDSVKIPRNTLIAASDLTEGSNVPYATADYGGVTVSKKWVGAAQKFTQELLSVAAVDIIRDQLQLIGYAISKKIDEDILAELQLNGTAANGNYIDTGSNRINYTYFIDAVELAKENDADPDVMLLHPLDWAALMKDTDFKQALAFATTPEGAVMPQVQEAAGVRIITSSVVPAGNVFLIDSKQLGYFVDFSEVITYDGRIPDQISFEVIGAKAYGVGISQPKAYVRLEKTV